MGTSNQDFEAWISSEMSHLRNYCYYLAKTKWDADDLLQEALLKLYLFFQKHPDTPIGSSLMYSIVRNLWIDQYRKQMKSHLISLNESESFHFDVDYAEVSGAIAWLSERLNEKYIKMWLLSQCFGYSLADLSNEFQCSIPAVKAILHRAKRAIEAEETKNQRKKINKSNMKTLERYTQSVLQQQPEKIIC